MGRVDGRVQRRIRSRSEARVRATQYIRRLGIAALSVHLYAGQSARRMTNPTEFRAGSLW